MPLSPRCDRPERLEDRPAKTRASSPAPASLTTPAGSRTSPAGVGRSKRGGGTDSDEADVDIDPIADADDVAQQPPVLVDPGPIFGRVWRRLVNSSYR
jgi:hypothetical protein